jgi:hypothetical protein
MIQDSRDNTVAPRDFASKPDPELDAAFVLASQLARDARLLHDEAIATNVLAPFTNRLDAHRTALAELRDRLHDLRQDATDPTVKTRRTQTEEAV